MKVWQNRSPRVLRISLAPLVAFAVAAPAVAQSVGVSIPEPSDGALFALGVVGLIVGRQVARKRK
ncbi:hypothetical protein IP81_01570 [Novosphingobium sp. AAP83]|nr:hypothetical protein IP81_01570 [Novosphingobium sp. AAP83]